MKNYKDIKFAQENRELKEIYFGLWKKVIKIFFITGILMFAFFKFMAKNQKTPDYSFLLLPVMSFLIILLSIYVIYDYSKEKKELLRNK